MIELNLPAFSPKLTKKGNDVFIFDPVRKKKLLLTPEEWVRQHVLNYLITHKNFPASLLRTEQGIAYHKLKKRCDIMAYAPGGEVLILVECKAPFVNIGENELMQTAAYTQSQKPKIVWLTNGLIHYFLSGEGIFYDYTRLPEYECNL